MKRRLIEKFHNDICPILSVAVIMLGLLIIYKSIPEEQVEARTPETSIQAVRTAANVNQEVEIQEDIEPPIEAAVEEVEEIPVEEVTEEVTEEVEEQPREIDAQLIRATFYTDDMTATGYPHDGTLAGKKEWLGREVYLYAVDENGERGGMLGEYRFEDTGYGINGSLIKGTSIDIWFPNEAAGWAFEREYGDYVYMEWR